VQRLVPEPGPELLALAQFLMTQKMSFSLLFLSFFPYSGYAVGWTTEESEFDSR
jgi:hypothetical protein